MKVKQVVSFEADSVYISWNNDIQFSDNDGNEVTITLSNKSFESLCEEMKRRIKTNKEAAIEELKQQLEEVEDADS